MSWKPSRSSGVMFDKFSSAARYHWEKTNEMIESHEYLKFEKMNQFSKHVYLHYLNDNKAFFSLCSKKFNHNNPNRHVVAYMPAPVLNMFKRNIHLVYKPMQKLLRNQQP